MIQIACLLVFVTVVSSLFTGPCHEVTTVDVPLEKWEGSLYVNVLTNNPGAKCGWVSRHVETTPDGKDIITDGFIRIENENTTVSTMALGEKVGKGHYKFTRALASGYVVEFQAYFMHYDVPNLDCHFVCSDDPMFQNGTGAFYCESAYPDAKPENAALIREIAEKNGFDINGLMMMDNCDCPINVPWPNNKSECKHLTAEEFFAGTSSASTASTV